MRATFIAMLILLLPAALLASPTMGVYFTYVPGQMYYTPYEGQHFDAYVFAHNSQCYIDAAEFKVSVPEGIDEVGGFDMPPGSVNLGDPLSGVSISYWPPLNGYYPGYNLLCTLHLFAYEGCGDPDGMMNAPIQIVPHPDSGFISAACWPAQNVIYYTGLTSIICPSEIAVQTKTWGSIKSLF